MGKPQNKVIIDDSYSSSLAQRHGLDIEDEDFDTQTSETDMVDIHHVDKAGKSHKISIPVGKDLSRKTKNELKKTFQEFSDVFWDDPNNFPMLRDPDTGKIIEHKLNLREDAILRNQATVLKLPEEQAQAMKKTIAKKLANGCFIRLPPTESSYCSPVSMVPKSTPDANGNKRWRLVQT